MIILLLLQKHNTTHDSLSHFPLLLGNVSIIILKTGPAISNTVTTQATLSSANPIFNTVEKVSDSIASFSGPGGGFGLSSSLLLTALVIITLIFFVCFLISDIFLAVVIVTVALLLLLLLLLLSWSDMLAFMDRHLLEEEEEIELENARNDDDDDVLAFVVRA